MINNEGIVISKSLQLFIALQNYPLENFNQDPDLDIHLPQMANLSPPEVAVFVVLSAYWEQDRFVNESLVFNYFADSLTTQQVARKALHSLHDKKVVIINHLCDDTGDCIYEPASFFDYETFITFIRRSDSNLD